MNRLSIVFFVLFFTGCAAPQAIIRSDIMGVVPKPSSGKAIVVFARPTSYQNAFNTRIYDGETLIGLIQGKTYFAYETTPGKHEFAALGHETPKYTNIAYLDADLLPGRTYYVGISFYAKFVGAGMQFWTGFLPIRPGDKKWDEMKSWLPGECARIEMTDRAQQVEQSLTKDIAKARKRFSKDRATNGEPLTLRPEDGV